MIKTERLETQLHSAYIIHTRAFRETSLILDILTPGQGRVRAVARGAMSRRSKWKAVLQPFSPVLLSWAGKGELKTLKTAELAGNPNHLRGVALYSGLYLNELLVRVLREQDDCHIIFTAYEIALQGLTAGKHPEPLLRRFELALLEQLGYAIPFPELTAELLCANFHYTLAGNFEPINLTRDDQRLRCFQGKELAAVAAGDFRSQSTLKSAKRLMRLAMAPILGDKPLQSRELFTQKKMENNE